MKIFEDEVQEYIINYCETNNVAIDLRFRCFADINKFWSGKTNTCFELECVNYYAHDTEDIKTLVSCLIDVLWEQATQPSNRIALYIQNIVDHDCWVDVAIGSCLFEDDKKI